MLHPITRVYGPSSRWTIRNSTWCLIYLQFTCRFLLSLVPFSSPCNGKSKIHERHELFKQHRYLLRASLSFTDAGSSPRGGRLQITLLVISYRLARNRVNSASANPLNDALWCWSNRKKQEQRALALPRCRRCWVSSPKPPEWSVESRALWWWEARQSKEGEKTGKCKKIWINKTNCDLHKCGGVRTLLRFKWKHLTR